jgi:membrane fusion protein (multidrug efflux system)
MKHLAKLAFLLIAIIGLYLLWIWQQHIATGDENAGAAPQSVSTLVDVRVGTISRATLHQTLVAYGTIEPAPGARAQISSPTAARIAEVFCREGQAVQKDQPLFAMDSREIDAEIDQYKKAAAAYQAVLDQSAKDSKADGSLLTVKTLLDVADAELAKAVARRSVLTITAPFAGTITLLNVAPGQIADPSKPSVELTDLNHLAAALNIPPSMIGAIKLGQKATIESAKSTESTVTFIDAALSSSGTGSVDVAVTPQMNLRPGQFIKASIITQEKPDCLVVPAEAIVRDSRGRPQIALVSADRHSALLSVVETGLLEGDQVEIIGEGLDAGQIIVTTGAYALIGRSEIHIVGE